ncbi:hypothetical protein CONLIGDRAFT_695210 [Coniochaeta ligniaria NRRL 30616]|uniref:Clr5 domain-containing protein n=1 Tax=Coniochaeta ligniaria NRRL 30616 TaxID=1408157 RepID=A0A1J7J0L8_9PEZI|nr:hypothetical protein CONLIGDRAFT_695210 [Coniochaeta ligniaria NRRL 30616]
MDRQTAPIPSPKGNFPDSRLSNLSPRGPCPVPHDSAWEERRQSIERLYLTENGTLSEVMRAMEQKHQFKASRKMYKTRFSKWGWHKYQSRGRQQAVSAGIPVSTTSGEKSYLLRPPLLHLGGVFVEMGSASGGAGYYEGGNAHAEFIGSDIMNMKDSPSVVGPVSITEKVSTSAYEQDSTSSPYSISDLCNDIQMEGDSGTHAVAGSAREMEGTQIQHHAISALGQDVFFTEEFVAQSPDTFWDDQ